MDECKPLNGGLSNGDLNHEWERRAFASEHAAIEETAAANERQGLTLIHYSAQLEQFLTKTHTLNTPNTLYHPLNTPETTPK